MNYTFYINFSTFCNYTCFYCRNKDFIKHKNINIKILLDYFNKFINIKNINNIQIYLEGDGEPTLHPDLLEFCEKIQKYNKNIIIIILTNLSQSINYYLQFSSFKNLKFIISWHSNIYDKYNKNFIKKIKFLKNKLVIEEIRIVFEPKNTYTSVLIFNICQNLFKNLNLMLLNPINIYSKNEIQQYLKILKIKKLDKIDIINNINNRYLTYFIDVTGDVYKSYDDYFYKNKILNNIYNYLNDDTNKFKI